MKRIVIYGATAIAKLLTDSLKEGNEIVAYMVDRGYEHTFSKIVVGGQSCITTDHLMEIDFDYVAIAFTDIEAGIKRLLENGVAREKIVAFSYGGNTFRYAENRLQAGLTKEWESEVNIHAFREIFSIEPPRFYICALNSVKDNGMDDSIIEFDYVREKTLQLLSKEIYRRNVKGSVAEVGVYKGAFSRKINRLFPDRQLYLFDTFEGFDGRDLGDRAEFKAENLNAFKDTSVESVLGKMEHPDMCIVRKGYFPESFDMKDEGFALVSLDADLYAPLLSGLEIFYPRLNKGGYIMVHDYNGLEYGGAERAVMEYCDRNQINYVPIPDMAGTVVISK